MLGLEGLRRGTGWRATAWTAARAIRRQRAQDGGRRGEGRGMEQRKGEGVDWLTGYAGGKFSCDPCCFYGSPSPSTSFSPYTRARHMGYHGLKLGEKGF